MLRADAAQDVLPRSGAGDDVVDAIVRKNAIPPKLPKDFRADHDGNGIRLKIVDRDKLVDRSGTTSYAFSHASDVDTSTQAGRDAGFARAVHCGQVFAPGEADRESTYYLSDTRYQKGVFFCAAIDSAGTPSETYLWAALTAGEILDSTVPDDVQHLQVSESGLEAEPGVMVSEIAVSCEPPDPLGSFAGVQLYLRDYTKPGEMVEGAYAEYDGSGTLQLKPRYSPFRRGTGLITLFNSANTVSVAGGQLLSEVQAGDVIEAVGRGRGTIGSVTNDSTATLASNWLPADVAGVEFVILPRVTVFAVSVSRGGTRRSDVENAPSVAVLFDADLSAPNAPTITATAAGNAVRIEFQQVLGTKIEQYSLYRGIGAAVPFHFCNLLDSLKQTANITLASRSLLQFEDASFTANDKETGQTFTYYVTATNIRGEESVPSNAAQVSARRDGSTDVDPGTFERTGVKNLLYNAFFGGTAAAAMAETDTNQDAFNGTDASNLPGKPYGGAGAAAGSGRFKGHTRWHSTSISGAPLAKCMGDGSVFYDVTGGSAGTYLFQEIDAWNTGLGGAKGIKIKKNAVYIFSVFGKHNGTLPNGLLQIYIEQYNNDVLTGDCPRQYRDTGNNLQYYTGTAAILSIAGSSLLSSWQRYWAVFRMDSTLGTTKQVRINISVANTTVGGIYVTQPMFSEGETPALFTGDMGDPSVSQPDPSDPPSGIGDGVTFRDGSGAGRNQQP